MQAHRRPVPASRLRLLIAAKLEAVPRAVLLVGLGSRSREAELLEHADRSCVRRFHERDHGPQPAGRVPPSHQGTRRLARVPAPAERLVELVPEAGFAASGGPWKPARPTSVASCKVTARVIHPATSGSALRRSRCRRRYVSSPTGHASVSTTPRAASASARRRPSTASTKARLIGLRSSRDVRIVASMRLIVSRCRPRPRRRAAPGTRRGSCPRSGSPRRSRRTAPTSARS